MPEFPSTTISLLHLEGSAHSVPPVHLTQLTPREQDIAALVADALSDKEIAERLYLSSHTVREYVKTIYRKLGVSSRVALTRVVLADPDSP